MSCRHNKKNCPECSRGESWGEVIGESLAEFAEAVLEAAGGLLGSVGGFLANLFSSSSDDD